MSLINEALRRARHEAERRDAARRGLAPPAAPSGGPPDRPLGSIALLAVLGLAIGVGVVGGAALFLRGGAATEPGAVAAGPPGGADGQRADEGRRSPADGTASPAVGAVDSGASGAADATDDPPRAVASTAPPIASSPAPTATEPAAPASFESGRDAAAERPLSTAARDASATELATSVDNPRRPQGADAGAGPAVARPDRQSGAEPPGRAVRLAPPRVTEDESGVLVVLADDSATGSEEAAGGPGGVEPSDGGARSYLRRVELADGQAVELGGIAWSETGPFALINGRVVGPGEKVSGLRVTGIEPKQVELQADDGATIYLRLK